MLTLCGPLRRGPLRSMRGEPQLYAMGNMYRHNTVDSLKNFLILEP